MAEENSYTMRELNAEDAFLMVRIISKIGIDRLKPCMEAASVKEAVSMMMRADADEKEKTDAMNSVGMLVMMEIASAVMERLPDCKEEIYTLLAQVSEQTKGDIAKMKLVPLIRMIKEFFGKEEFKDFFTEVSELLN